jgi:hypothetical protein
MSYDNLSSVSQNVLNFISSLPVKRGGALSFLVGTISNVLVMEIGWTDVGSGGYILVSRAHSNTSFKSYFNGLEFDIGPFMKIREIIFLNI